MSIRVENVSFEYTSINGKVLALDNVSFTVPTSSFYVITGESGSGKSTLLRLLNGLRTPSEGKIYLDGEDINSPSFPRSSLPFRVGLVFQYPEHQLFEATVFEDVCFGPKNMGLDKNEAELRAFTALEQVGMPHDLFYSSPFDLSGGQKRRAAIAGVLAMKPKILVLDEPTAGLDPKGRDDILDQISRLHEEENMSIVLVSHSMEDVANYVDRILVMNRGELVYNDVPKAVFAHIHELEGMGLAAPQVTYIMHKLREDGFNVDLNATTIDEACDNIMKALGR